MVTKHTQQGRPYEIDAKAITWHPEDDEGERGNLPDIRIPLRIKMKLVLQFADEGNLDNKAMVEMIRQIIPEAAHETLGEMDVNDFQDMFVTWQTEYNTLTGSSLGE